MVTEHGVSTGDDSRRAEFLKPSLADLLDGAGRRPGPGLPALDPDGQLAWIFGHGQQFGLHSVDRATFARSPKPSAAV